MPRIDPRGPRRRAAILRFLEVWEHRFSPTVREVGLGTGIPLVLTAYHLGVLRREGKVTWETGKQRTLELVKEDKFYEGTIHVDDPAGEGHTYRRKPWG